ncbi:MAG: radical SAM protein [Actinobacteria bacterium]|nr:radical SAM protein [Actinomycetota bacterium]
MEEESLFRYPLRPPGDARAERREPFVETVREQLRNILDIALPLEGERVVEVDGFRLLGPERGRHGLQDGRRRGTPAPPLPAARGAALENMDNVSLYEPRIAFLARQLESLLSLVQLECGGRPVEVDAFRLRRPSDWADAPVDDPADILNHAATRCRCDCIFCYNKGSLPSLTQPAREADIEWKYLEEQLRHYNPRARRGLFPRFGGPRDVLAHPHALPLLRALREKSDRPLRFSTSGDNLTTEVVSALAELAPLSLDLSLNSSSPARRSYLMRDPRPETAIRSLPLLAAAGIPYAVTVVAWPQPSLEEMLRDLGETCRYAADNHARLVQVNLPGYSRFFSPRPLFDSELVWEETVHRVQELRRELPCPIVVSPSMYEENLTRSRKNLAEVTGVVPGSPAARGGLRAGDVILEMNGIRVRNRPQARDLLTLFQQSGQDLISVTVRRNGGSASLRLHAGDHRYPYEPCTSSHLGAVFMGTGLRSSYLEDLRGMIAASGARSVLFLTSRLVRPTFEQLLAEHPSAVPGDVDFRLDVPENRYFGGNIILGDLLVVQDFIDHLREYAAAEGRRPDLVVIPSSPFQLSRWGRDLTGRPYLDIGRETGMRVRLLECRPIWE